MTSPAIAVLPYGRKLGPMLSESPVSDLIWPLGMPARLQGGTVGDLRRDDHLIVFPKTSTHFTLRRGTRARISLIQAEPSVIHAKHIALLRVTYRRFWRVLTFNEDLIARIPNGIFFPMGTTWVPNWRSLDTTKTRMCSLIASSKRDTEGHRLRHSVAERARENGLDLDIMGRGYAPFEAKSDGLAPYRYSVVIENVREKNYFSEKLADTVLCETVPIYWGCPNIDRFFDTGGMILCSTEADVMAALSSTSVDDYEARLPALKAIQPAMDGYCDIEKRAAKAVLSSL